MRIIPAIDIIDGKCVRLSKGDYDTAKIYGDDPLSMAKELESVGIKYLHLVDLDGAKSSGVINEKWISKIVKETNLTVDFGGGVKTIIDLEKVLDAGANQVTVGSIAIKNPELFIAWLEKFGSEKIIFGADCRNGFLSGNGWLEDSSLEIQTMLNRFIPAGLKYVICTDIEKDGMLNGPSVMLYEELLSKNNIQLIASGGVTTFEDLDTLEKLGCEGAIIGKALYEGKMDWKKLGERC
ncbi:MAG: 1-(5-phosphoribosyl)-5-[(5-phosphoribosylamino)methylideneamino]imidazole-4-carboxamide isomerase [Bacteroidetes bacterium]|nr:1-(5-phosphoribosyl)-5-[(5-phosphoribosylamino)methylideneamino]imidazole-4-carboxamide isomerase [Bacteroidota bacterium]